MVLSDPEILEVLGNRIDSCNLPLTKLVQSALKLSI